MNHDIIAAGLKPIVELPRALADAGYQPPDYRQCSDAAASARIPTQRIRNRWYFHPSDMPAIAAVLCPRAPGNRALRAVLKP